MTTYIDVFKLIKRQMNGAVSEAMDENGLKYAMNYGVSLVTIKDIAKNFAFDHQLAKDLYRQEIRELRLAAIYIEDPKLVTIEQANNWSEKWENTEIAQICAVELLCKTHNALEIATEWFNDENKLKHIAACHIVGKIANLHTSKNLKVFVTATNNAYCLREIYKYQPQLRNNISKIAEQVEDLAWQIEYI